jgi:hypothetical protein
MTTQVEDDGPAGEPKGVIPPQGYEAGVPFDLRRPTVARFKSRLWNRDDPRMFPPKSFGAGWAVNFYWLFHLASYLKGRRTRREGA